MARQATLCLECGGTEDGRRRCLSCLGLGYEDDPQTEEKPRPGMAPGLRWVVAGAAAVAGALHGQSADPFGDPATSAAMTGMLAGSGAMVVMLAIRSIGVVLIFGAMLVALDGIATGFSGTETVIERAPLLLYAVERYLGL